jgi:quinol monooxygenase YgiN
MFVALVFVHVRPEVIEDFKAITLENARNSVREAGIIRFDVVQQENDPTRFVLIEAYRSPEGPTAHRETAHYQNWRAQAEAMMAEPRTGLKFTPLFPAPALWEYPNVDDV